MALSRPLHLPVYSCSTKFVTRFAVICSFLSPVNIYAQPVTDSACRIQLATAGEALAGRRISVTLPDGQHLEIVGHTHGRELFAKISPLLEDLQLSNHKFNEKITEVLRDQESVIIDAQEDLEFLRQQLSLGQIAFVGIEANPWAADLKAEVSKTLYLKSVTEFERRNLRDPILRDNLNLAFSGAPYHLKNTAPESLRQVPIVGMDHDIVLEFPSMHRESDKKWERLRRTARKNSAQVKALHAEIHIWVKDYHLLDSSSDNEILDKYLVGIPTYLQAPVRDWLAVELRIARANSLRDKTIVSNLLDQKQSGILFIGRLHLESLEQRIRVRCQTLSAENIQ